MTFDNTLIMHGAGFLFAGYALCQAWSGEVSERTGFTTFKRNPIQFAISCGFQLMFGLLLIFATPEMGSMNKLETMVMLVGLTGACAVISAMVASVSSALREARSTALTPTEVERNSMYMGPSTLKVLGLCILWILLASILPFLYSNLGAPQFNGQYIKSVVGLFTAAILWLLMGGMLFMPYRASIESGRLLVRSLFCTQEIPLHQIKFIENGFFTVSFATRDRTYRIITILDESSESKQRANNFVKKLSAVSGAPHKVVLDLI